MKRIVLGSRAVAFLVLVVLVVTSTPGQEGSQDEVPIEESIARYPLKPPDTSSPRATLQSFIDSMNRSYSILMEAYQENAQTPGWSTPESIRQKGVHAETLFQRGVSCLNLTSIPQSIKREMGYERALMLKEILDRIELPAFDQIPDAEAIEREEEEERVPELHRWRMPNTNIVIARVEEGPRKGEFLFTEATVAALEKSYEKAKYLPYKSDELISDGFLGFYLRTAGTLLPPKWDNWLPAWSKKVYFSQTIWQWCGVVGVFLIASLLLLAAYRRLFSLRVPRSPADRHWNRVLFCLIAVITLLIIRYVGIQDLKLSGWFLVFLRFSLLPVFGLLCAVAAYNLGQAVAESIIASPRIDPQGLQASYLRALFGVLGFLAAAAILIAALSRVGVSLVPLLTGVGIGGLAVALAARPTLENIIAGFIIFADKPFRVGERVTVSGQMGEVEAIGLRSTKIRLLTGPLIVVPNEKMASAEVENIGRRRFIRRIFNITITYDTPPEKIDRAIEILHEILAVPEASETGTPDSAKEMKDIDPAEGNAEEGPHPNEAINRRDFPPRVYFNEFNADSLNLYVSYWYHPPEFWDAMEFAHRVNTQIVQRFNAEGIDFAFPTQTLHLAGDEKRPLTVGRRWESGLESQSHAAAAEQDSQSSLVDATQPQPSGTEHPEPKVRKAGDLETAEDYEG